MAAWDHISTDFLNDLIDSMPARCQAVIDANMVVTPSINRLKHVIY